MNDEDKRYLRSARKIRPGFEVFNRMVQILSSVEKKTELLVDNANKFLLKTSKTIDTL